MRKPNEAAIDSVSVYISDLREVSAADAAAMVQQRDDLTSKIRFGLVALNGASIVAMMGLLNGSGDLARALGFSSQVAFWSVVFFLIGAISAGVCLASHQNEMILKAGYAKARFDRLRGAHMILRAPEELNPDKLRQSIAAIDESHKDWDETLKPNVKAIRAQHLASGAWLGGVLLPILSSPHVTTSWHRVWNIVTSLTHPFI